MLTCSRSGDGGVGGFGGGGRGGFGGGRGGFGGGGGRGGDDDVGLNRRGMVKSLAGPAAEFMPPNILAHFRPRDPLPYLPPPAASAVLHKPEPSRLTGVAALLQEVRGQGSGDVGVIDVLLVTALFVTVTHSWLPGWLLVLRR